MGWRVASGMRWGGLLLPLLLPSPTAVAATWQQLNSSYSDQVPATTTTIITADDSVAVSRVDAERELEVRLQVPNPGFELHIIAAAADAATGRLALLARVTPPPRRVTRPQVVSEISDRITIRGDYQQVQHYVIGRTWQWDDPRVTFLDSAAQFNALRRQQGLRLLPRELNP